MANLPEAERGAARDKAAAVMGVGGRTVDYAMRLNFERRQLTKVQKAAAAKARGIYEAQALLRKAHGKTAPGRTLVEHASQAKGGVKGKARDLAGKAFGVSGYSVDAATKVLKSGDAEQSNAPSLVPTHDKSGQKRKWPPRHHALSPGALPWLLGYPRPQVS